MHPTPAIDKYIAPLFRTTGEKPLLYTLEVELLGAPLTIKRTLKIPSNMNLGYVQKPYGGVIELTFFDDILATGGTARGIAESLNGQKINLDGKVYDVKVTDFVFLVEIDPLGGRKLLEDLGPVKSVIHVESD